MRYLLTALALLPLAASPALAFEAGTTDVLARLKAGKPVKIADVATLMRESERWCYNEQAGQCDWTDVYLSVTEAGAVYEIGNGWSETQDMYIVEEGALRDNRFICETGFDWVPSVAVIESSDGAALRGRPLQEIKDSLDATRGRSTLLCFDYLYLRSDEAAETVTLLQRTHEGYTILGEQDIEVTLHFDPASAAALRLSR